MNDLKYFPFLISTILLFLSCTQPDKKANTPAQGDTVSVAQSPEPRPPHKEMTIRIEGMKELMPANLYEAPADFPLSFSTYIPGDMQVEMASRKGEKVVRIIAAFGGRLNRDVIMDIGALPGVANAQEARTYARDMVQNMAGLSPAEDVSRHPWAEETYALRGDRVGFLSLAKQEGRWFYVLLLYPPVYGDGIAPRSAMILNQWRWSDTEVL